MPSIIKRTLGRIERVLGLDKLFARNLLHLLKDKKGIEIGGPTKLFSEGLPIYHVVESLDGCNFSDITIWENTIEKGFTYNYGGKHKGYQYISEASDLNEVPDNKYDFILASHCLEHCANALKTVKEWVRVIKPGGFIVLILPDKRFTFDHKREITSFRHIKEDFYNNVDEKDLTHLEEILSLHDLSRDIPAGDINHFRQRSLNNFENRCLHHHVFDFALLTTIYSELNINVHSKKLLHPFHQIIVGTKREVL